MPNLIQTTRSRLGISNRELAERLGVTKGAVSQLERSERNGSIRWASLERALTALGHQPAVIARKPVSPYSAEAVTEIVNHALDDGDETYALRVITRAAQAISGRGRHDASELAERSSAIKDPRWETLFGAIYGDALGAEPAPDWARPAPLRKRWYVSKFEPLRERAKTTTPSRLRGLNIYLDARSLERR
jgi:transcriptional regulator with XRE-family HTH domain